MSKDKDTLNKLKSMEWERWLERPFHAFLASCFEDSTRKENFVKIGVPDTELRAQLYQDSTWHLNHDAIHDLDKQVGKYLKSHTIFDITDGLAKFRTESRSNITAVLATDISIPEKYVVVHDVLVLCCTYIWLAHGLESYFNQKLQTEVPKYIENDIDTFIGDAGFPIKKNAHALMEDMMRAYVPSDKIAKTYGWVKSRDGFTDSFTPEEIDAIRKELPAEQKHVAPDIPEALEDLFVQVKELVFFRTERTDVFYEMFHFVRPFLIEMAEAYGIAFDDLKYYRAKTFTEGKPVRYESNVGFAYLDGEVLFQNGPLLEAKKFDDNQAITGIIACKGKVAGTVKVIKTVDEIDKVEVGDILVTQMTFPSFIPAMIKAVAFVTDEGGITCHAAIVSREMKKPCIIGTKIATQVLKDGMEVEVDADNGVVKVLK